MAWTGNFKDRIDDLAGLLDPVDNDAIQEWIRDGCYDVLTKAVTKHGMDETWKFAAKSSAQTTNHIDVDEFRTMVGVVRDSTFAVKGKWELKNKFYDSGSIYAATANTPVWYLDNSKLSIYPSPSVSETANYYYIPEYTITSWNADTSSINNYPSEYYYHVALFASIKVLHRRMLDSSITALEDFIALPVEPSPPTMDTISLSFSGSLATASIDYTNATAITVATSDVDAFSGAPDYAAPDGFTFDLFADFAGTLGNLSVSTPSPSSPALNTASVSLTGTAPIYTPPTALSISAYATHASTLGVLSISATPPANLSAPTISSSGVGAVSKADMDGNVPAYTKPDTIVTAVIPDIPTLSTISFTETNALNVSAAAPSALVLTEVSYNGITDVDATVDDVSSTTIDISTATQPIYNSGAVIGMDDGTLAHNLAPTTIADLSLIPVPPEIPTLTSITYSAATNADASSPTVATTAYISPTFLDRLDMSSIALSSATITGPAITAEDVTTLGVLDLPDIAANVPYFSQDGTSNARIGFGTGTGQQFAALATKVVTDLSVDAVPPDTPNLSTVSYTPATAVTITGTSDIEVSDMANTGAVSVTSITAASSSQPSYTAPTVSGALSLAGNLEVGATIGLEADENDFGKWFSVVGQLIEDEEDIELANASMQKISTFINAYQADVQNSLNDFNKETQIYQALVQQDTQNANAANQAVLNDIQRLLQENQANMQKNQSIDQANQQKDIQENQTNSSNAQAKALQDAQQAVQAVIADNNSLMQKYSNELSVYQAEVNTQIQEYTNNFQKESQLWQQTQTHIIQQHSQTMQDALNVFNAQNAKYQASVQAEMLRTQSLSAEYQKEADMGMQAKIQDYTFELQEWSHEVQRYQANISAEVQKYQQNLSNYSASQQDAIQVAQIANQAHLQEAQGDLQVAIRNKDKDAELALQNAINTMQSIIQGNQVSITKYQAEVQTYQIEVNSATQEWQANTNKDLQLWQQTQQLALQEQSQRMQDALNLFNEENAEYQAEVNALMTQATLTNGENLQNLQKDLQIAIRNKDKSQEHQLQEVLQDMQAIIADNQRKIAQYSAESQQYTAEVNEQVQNYTSRLQSDVQDMQASIADNQKLLDKYKSEVVAYQAEVGVDIQIIQANITNELNEFNKDNARYQANVQAEITHAQIDAQQALKIGDLALQADIQDYTLDLQRFQGEVAKYQAEVNDSVQEYTQNLQRSLQTWTGEQAHEAQRYQNEMQNALNVFNDANVEYQAKLQKDVQDAQLSDAADSKKITKYQAEIADYQAEVNTQVSVHTQNLQKALQTWTTEQANKLAKYQVLQQDSVQSFNRESVAFQADIQKQLAEYQADIQIAIKNGDNTTQIDLANRAKKLEADINDYTFDLQKYQAELGEATASMQANVQNEQNKLAKYGADIQAYGSELAVYQGDVASKIQKYQANLQGDGVSYQWLQDQYSRLKEEYERAFMVPQQQQAGG